MQKFWNWLKQFFVVGGSEKKDEPARVDNPAFLKAKDFEGKGEKDKAFVSYMSSFWKLVKLPHYKTIVGSSFAWCALFIVMAQSGVGQKYIASAAAKRHIGAGISIDWKTNGIPRGAIVQTNHKFKCGSSDGNHVGFSDGDCAPEDLKSGTFNLYGGNQQNSANVTSYDVREICYVGWPSEVPLPGKITKSVGCKEKKKSAGSTK